jgi:hypothetical protein
MEASDSLLLHKSATAEVINQVSSSTFSLKICLLTLFLLLLPCVRERENYQANPQGVVVVVSWG